MNRFSRGDDFGYAIVAALRPKLEDPAAEDCITDRFRDDLIRGVVDDHHTAPGRGGHSLSAGDLKWCAGRLHLVIVWE